MNGEEWLGLSAEAWSALAAWLTLGVLLGTLLFAWVQVREAKRIRREQSRPHVVVDIAIRQQLLAYLTVENVGNVAAKKVQISFDKPLATSLGNRTEANDVKFLREPIPTLPPRKRYWVIWDSMIELLKDDVPKLYRAEVTYESPDGFKHKPEEYVIDLEMYRGQAIEEKGLPELVKALEELRKEHHKWTDGASGLFVKSVDRNIYERRSVRPIRIRQAKKEFEKGGVPALIRYWIGVVRRRYGLWSR